MVLLRRSMFDGSFYPHDKGELEEFIKIAIKKAKVPRSASSAASYIAPHAGYEYSGKIAAFTYKAIKENKKLADLNTIIVIGPNHTGLGEPIAVSMDDWETPLGVAANDKELSKAITLGSKYISRDEVAHRSEHSIEVQLPFIKYMFPYKKLSFICMGDQSIRASEMLANSLVNAANSLERDVLVIASSDLTHYEPLVAARKSDSGPIAAIKKLDFKAFNAAIIDFNHSACGPGPIGVAMLFARNMGAKKGIMLKYGSSAETTKDYSSVVTYSSMALV